MRLSDIESFFFLTNSKHLILIKSPRRSWQKYVAIFEDLAVEEDTVDGALLSPSHRYHFLAYPTWHSDQLISYSNTEYPQSSSLVSTSVISSHLFRKSYGVVTHNSWIRDGMGSDRIQALKSKSRKQEQKSIVLFYSKFNEYIWPYMTRVYISYHHVIDRILRAHRLF